MAIRVSVLYPAGSGSRFDHVYYAGTHMPMAARLLNPLRCEVDRGLGGGAPGSEAPYVAGCHFWFDSINDFASGFATAGAALQADIPNYTDIAPVIQISASSSRSKEHRVPSDRVEADGFDQHLVDLCEVFGAANARQA